MLRNKKINKILFIKILIFYCLLIIANAATATSDQLIQIDPAQVVINQAQNRIIEQNLTQKKFNEAIILIDNELIKEPNNVKLLFKKAEIYADIEQYEKAITTLDKIISLQPKNEKALSFRKKIEDIIFYQPKNELGINTDEAYVSDIKKYWHYSNLHYYRFTSRGAVGGRVNFANRYGTSAAQYQFEAYPKFPNNSFLQYIRLNAAFADSTQTLFPTSQYTVEPYFNLPKNFEFSLGFSALHAIGNNIYTYTGSVGYYLGNNYLWFRPYHYTPKPADFYEAGIRHYFKDNNIFLSIKAGTGKVPDILDFAPLNQIAILNQQLIAINAQIAVKKNIYLQMGAGFIRQKFPSGIIRDITDGSLGLIWQF